MTDSTQALKERLATLRQTARLLLQTAAAAGGEMRLNLIDRHSLLQTRADIAQCKADLRAQGVSVDDMPEDKAGYDTNLLFSQLRGITSRFVLPVFLFCSYTLIISAWFYFKEFEKIVFSFSMIIFTLLYCIFESDLKSIQRKRVFMIVSSIFVVSSVLELCYVSVFRENNTVAQISPDKIYDTKTLYVDEGARYFIQIYNCDDICAVYLPGNNTPITKIRYNQTSDLVEITDYLVDNRTKFKFEVINETLKIAYGIKIFKLKDGQNNVLERTECGTSAGYGCNNDIDYNRGVVVEIEYDFVKP